MVEFINHARHNENFHRELQNLSFNDYADWKIICLFYVAIHYLKALSKHRNKKIGESHKEINYNIGNNTRNGKPTMPINTTAYSNYIALYSYSQDARYEGYTDFALFKGINEGNYNHAVKCLEDFKKYISTSGIPVV